MLALSFFGRKKCALREIFLRLEFVNSLVAPVKADPVWALFIALICKE